MDSRWRCDCMRPAFQGSTDVFGSDPRDKIKIHGTTFEFDVL